MRDYKSVFDEAQRKAHEDPNFLDSIPNFRNHPEFFHFVMAAPDKLKPNTGSLNAALEINPVAQYLIGEGPSLLGGGPPEIDAVESHHILMMAYLVSKIGRDWGNVVEIGGGYGNCLRLVHKYVTFTKWSIIDLDFILELQKWFLTNWYVNLSNVEFKTEPVTLTPNLVIGTHSLSEISLDDFMKYMEFIQHSNWLFYVCHNAKPSIELLDRKFEVIHTYFNIIGGVDYEDGNSTMFLFKRK